MTLAPTTADRRYARRDARQAERDTAYREACDAATTAGYPDLDGTEPMIRWAMSIRQSIATTAGDRISAAVAADDPHASTMLDVLEAILTETRAAWFIDHGRGLDVPMGDGSLTRVSTFDIALYARRKES